MKNTNDILKSINDTIANSSYSYSEYRERIGDPIRPVETKFINGPLKDINGTINDSSNHVIDSTVASSEKAKLIYKEAAGTLEAPEHILDEISKGSSMFNSMATLHESETLSESEGHFRIGNNLIGGKG